MTKNRSFKTLVRERMAQTGQSYATARTHLLAELSEAATRAEAEHRTVLSRFLKDDGSLAAFPSKRKARAHILLYLVNLFESGRTYREPEINQILAAVWSDFAYLRRELVDYGYLRRDNAGAYWLTDFVPSRAGTVLHAEAPDWEDIWLPGYLSS